MTECTSLRFMNRDYALLIQTHPSTSESAAPPKDGSQCSGIWRFASVWLYSTVHIHADTLTCNKSSVGTFTSQTLRGLHSDRTRHFNRLSHSFLFISIATEKDGNNSNHNTVRNLFFWKEKSKMRYWKNILPDEEIYLHSITFMFMQVHA